MGKYEYSGEGFLTLTLIAVGVIFVIMNSRSLKGVIKWPFIIFILFCGLTFFVAEDAANFSKKFARLVGYFFLYMMVVQLSLKDENRKTLSYALLLSILITNLPAVYMNFIAPDKYVSHLQESGLKEVGIMAKNNFGLFSCYMALFLIYLYSTARSKLSKSIFVFLFLMQTALLVISFTRTAWVGFIAAFPVLILFSRNRARLLIPFLGMVLIAASLYSIVYYGAYGELTERKEYGYSSLHFRTAYAWPASIKAFQEKPFMGWGLGNDRYALTKAAKLNQTSHNDYLLVLVETGIIGLLLYLWLLTSLFHNTIASIRKAEDERSRTLCVSALSILVAYLVASMGEHLLQTPGATGSVITVLGMAHGTLLASRKNASSKCKVAESEYSPLPSPGGY
jgi:O-antigen ligase